MKTKEELTELIIEKTIIKDVRNVTNFYIKLANGRLKHYKKNPKTLSKEKIRVNITTRGFIIRGYEEMVAEMVIDLLTLSNYPFVSPEDEAKQNEITKALNEKMKVEIAKLEEEENQYMEKYNSSFFFRLFHKPKP